MNRPLSLALCTALAMAPAAASADETYRLCGGGSAGFIRVGGAVACIGGSVDWRSQPQAAGAATARPPAPERDYRSVINSQVQRERLLVAGDCGRPPEERDYDIGPWKPKNQLGQTMYNREMAAWRQCADRVMATKFKTENDAMTREALEAGKRDGIF